MTNTATESNIHSTLGYALVNPPAGTSIDANGIITWTPQQNQSPSTNLITTVVTNTNPYDLVNPHLSATNSFTVVVKEVNVAPVLPVIATQTVNELTLLTVTNTATRIEHPLDPGLRAGQPAGRDEHRRQRHHHLDAQQTQSPSTNLITTVVTNTNPLRPGQPAPERHQQFHGDRAGSERGAGAAGHRRPRPSTNWPCSR